MRKAGLGSYELVNDSSGTVIAKYAHKIYRQFPQVITSQGQTYKWRRVGKRSWFSPESRVKDLVNVATNAPVLQMRDAHLGHRAGTRVTIVGQRELSFPVKGQRLRAIMSAIDESGNSLIEYRLVPSKRQSHFDRFGWTEVVVSPTAETMPHIELLISVSRQFLWGFFQLREKTGGG